MLTQIKKITKVKKRTGEVVDFNKDKIKIAISKAMVATDSLNELVLESVVDKIVLVLESKFMTKVPSVEDVQDVIEYVLIASELSVIAKAYILYREDRRRIREATEETEDSIDVKKLREQNVELSKQAVEVLNNSQQLSELGKLIFLDRYSVKTKKEDIVVGDLVIVLTKEDYKFPKKDIGIVKKIVDKDKLTIHMITGVYASKENNFEFFQERQRCEKPSESVNMAYKRVARAVASVEKDEMQKSKYFEEFWSALKKNQIQPAGRIMTGASIDEFGYTSNLTLYNCYVIPSPKDSRKSIIKDTLFSLVEVFSRGGGCGLALSSLRPKYSYVKGVHGRSSGSVSFGNLYSFITGLIEQGGSRRGALMLMLADWHPDIVDFITAKKKLGMLENANISVLISDDLMDAVVKDEMWNLEFPDYENEIYHDIYDEEWDGDLKAWKAKNYPTRIYKSIKARDLWNEIITSAWESAEPGIVFIDRYNKMSNSYYYNKVVATNPCGEQGLPPWGVCNLGHLYLASFVDKTGDDEIGPIYDINWDELKKASRTLVRFLDNIIDLTPYFFEENERLQKSERRIGCGTLGLAELLIKLRIKYGSPESLSFIDKLYKTITSEMYMASALIAEEKGFFSKFDSNKFLASGFMREMPEEVRAKIKEKGMRNVSITTQAPTGTVGTMLGTSTGIEPYFAFKFYRQSRLGFHEENIPIALEYAKDNKLPDFFVGAMDLGPTEHIKVQAAIQRWTDSSISKTANVPSNFTIEETKELYIKAYELGCKGVTIYRDNSRSEQVLSTDKGQEKKNEDSVKKQLDDKAKNKQQSESENTRNLGQDKIVYGADAGNNCPNCKVGIMIKLGGCTECSRGCGFKGACDLKT